MHDTLAPEERLIVAADFKPNPANKEGRNWVRRQVLTLADSLKDTGVYLKVNSALRACGYDLIHDIHMRNLKVCADLKLVDISETLSIDGALLDEFSPEIVTVFCSSSVKVLKALKMGLPTSEVIGVTVLTNLRDVDTRAIFACSPEVAVLRLAEVARQARLDGLVAAPTEARILFEQFGVGGIFTINTPDIRPSWHVVEDDDQNPERTMTIGEAIRAGVTRIIVGRPITQSAKPYDAVMRTIDEITSAVA